VHLCHRQHGFCSDLSVATGSTASALRTGNQQASSVRRINILATAARSHGTSLTWYACTSFR
jgi:hypothetical protein